MPKLINIAIDGYSSCGKSTLAKSLAEHLRYAYIDSGAMYRAITYYALTHSIISSNELDHEALIKALPNIHIEFHYHPETHLGETLLNGDNVENRVRSLEVSAWVSRISKISEVRRQLVFIQRKLGANRGVVMDGRDIGTVVFPDAELKLFLTARPDIRAKRRLLELKEKGMAVSYEEVLDNLNHRDFEDTHRALDPLRRADDAILLDNSDLSKEEQFELCLSYIAELVV